MLTNDNKEDDDKEDDDKEDDNKEDDDKENDDIHRLIIKQKQKRTKKLVRFSRGGVRIQGTYYKPTTISRRITIV